MIDGNPLRPERFPPRGVVVRGPVADNQFRYGYALGVLGAFVPESELAPI